ncbi:MAG TPA: nitrous oxide-stimulated promoter family protein [Myxococcota bacterium]|nr:nitrous oxide-stimulated promoter family protein [Myxococcota bacterium]
MQATRGLRESRTVLAMIRIFCRGCHGTDGRNLCGNCDELFRYVQARIEKCRYDDDKPTCLNCRVHCFKPAMREQIRLVMRYAGPRMPLRHPYLTLMHILDGHRKPPP